MTYKLHNPNALDRVHEVDRPIWLELLQRFSDDLKGGQLDGQKSPLLCR